MLISRHRTRKATYAQIYIYNTTQKWLSSLRSPSSCTSNNTYNRGHDDDDRAFSLSLVHWRVAIACAYIERDGRYRLIFIGRFSNRITNQKIWMLLRYMKKKHVCEISHQKQPSVFTYSAARLFRLAKKKKKWKRVTPDTFYTNDDVWGQMRFRIEGKVTGRQCSLQCRSVTSSDKPSHSLVLKACIFSTSNTIGSVCFDDQCENFYSWLKNKWTI